MFNTADHSGPAFRIIRSAAEFFLLNGLAVVAQAGSFLVAARLLSPGELGAVLGMNSAASILIVVSLMGAPDIIIKERVQITRDGASVIKTAVLSVLARSLAVCMISVAVCPSVLFDGENVAMVTLVCVADLVLTPLVVLREMDLVAAGDMRRAALQRAALSGARAVGAITCCVALSPLSAKLSPVTAWALGSLFGTTLIALMSVSHLSIHLRSGKFRLSLDTAQASLWFSLFRATGAVQANLDRVLALPLLPQAEMGIYVAASRLAQIGLLPASALLRTTYSGFFKGNADIVTTRYHYSRVIALVVGLGLTVSLTGIASSPLLSIMLGPAYEFAESPFRTLCALFVFVPLYSASADALAGLGRYGIRAAIELCGLAILIPLTFVGIKLYGAEGAALARSVHAAGTASVCLTAALLIFRSRKQSNG